MPASRRSPVPSDSTRRRSHEPPDLDFTTNFGTRPQKRAGSPGGCRRRFPCAMIPTLCFRVFGVFLGSQLPPLLAVTMQRLERGSPARSRRTQAGNGEARPRLTDHRSGTIVRGGQSVPARGLGAVSGRDARAPTASLAFRLNSAPPGGIKLGRHTPGQFDNVPHPIV